MATRSDRYIHSVFSVAVLEEAIETFRRLLPARGEDDFYQLRRTVRTDRSEWTYDSDSEFFAACRRSMSDVRYSESLQISEHKEGFSFYFLSTRNVQGIQLATVTIESLRPEIIAAVAGIFEKHADSARLPDSEVEDGENEEPLKVFIGHGHDPAWRDLKDHLTDRHGITIEAYEIGARAGHAVRNILQSMLKTSSMAFLVMTGDDEAGGNARPRQNVVHEAGLFQGALGFERAIVLLEKGVESFSNIDGIETIRFTKGNIRSTFGDVIATIRREFPSV